MHAEGAGVRFSLGPLQEFAALAGVGQGGRQFPVAPLLWSGIAGVRLLPLVSARQGRGALPVGR